jgi:hypothetical protein
MKKVLIILLVVFSILCIDIKYDERPLIRDEFGEPDSIIYIGGTPENGGEEMWFYTTDSTVTIIRFGRKSEDPCAMFTYNIVIIDSFTMTLNE